MRRRILSVVGARPNFIKVAPVHRALARYADVESRVLHTGQHYDRVMSEVFFADLELPAPDVYLGVGSGSHAEQTAAVMVAFERHVVAERPAFVTVYGDVNSTLACALVAAKLGIPLAHVEAGLRSFDRTMPEEINRLVTDALADALYVSEPSGLENLRREGRGEGAAVHVGNVMIDSLVRHLDRALERVTRTRFGLDPRAYTVVTLHRPSNVDEARRLGTIVDMIITMAERATVVFPVHPRTRNVLEHTNLGGRLAGHRRVHLTEPLSYLDFLGLLAEAQIVVTDSGGIQEETTYLGVPCITLRTTTERPITVEVGTNEVVGDDPARALAAFDRAISGRWKTGARPQLWDGCAAERIAADLVARLGAG